MRRIIFVLPLLVPSICWAQTRYAIEGEITSGTSLFPETRDKVPFQEYGAPPEGFPIPYRAALDIFGPPGEERIQFGFTAISEIGEYSHFASDPEAPSITQTEETFSLSSFDGRSFTQAFNIGMAFPMSSGSWTWQNDCPACFLAYPLPSAIATITSIEYTVPVVGDFNYDNELGVADIDLLTTVLSLGERRRSGDIPLDLDGDGVLTNLDRDVWLDLAAKQHGFSEPYQLGDANLDGVVDSYDLNIVGLHWNSDETKWSRGNFDAGAVDSGDLNLLARNWRSEISANPIAPVPEPSGIHLGIFALLYVAARRACNSVSQSVSA